MPRSIAFALAAVCSAAAPSAAQTELAGPVRDLARAAIVYPVVYDPLLVMPLTPLPQAVVEAHGADVAGTVHAALRSGDDSYGIVASAPLSASDPATAVDPRGLRRHASLGFHITNIIWHPRATPVLERQLGADGFVRLDEDARRKAAEMIASTDAVQVPWVAFFTADYRFNRAEYVFADPRTLDRRTDTRLNDTASILGGVQLFVRPRDPGYFFGVSYTYTAVFNQSDALAANGLPAEGPAKVRGNVVKMEVRRPLVEAHVAIDASLAYEHDSAATAFDVTAYWWRDTGRPASAQLSRWYVGVRGGNLSRPTPGGGAFATAFVGTSFPIPR